MGDNTIRRAARIGVIVAESGADKQVLLKQFADRRRGEGLRIAGLVEIAAPDAHSGCGALDLLDLATAARIAISQNLGPGSTACNLDPGGVAMACAAAQRAIEAGADLVVLSKFGKLEAGNGGLRDAFARRNGRRDAGADHTETRPAGRMGRFRRLPVR
jgi:hypothetical protein